jgi:hypothetical protein
VMILEIDREKERLARSQTKPQPVGRQRSNSGRQQSTQARSSASCPMEHSSVGRWCRGHGARQRCRGPNAWLAHRTCSKSVTRLTAVVFGNQARRTEDFARHPQPEANPWARAQEIPIGTRSQQVRNHLKLQRSLRLRRH